MLAKYGVRSYKTAKNMLKTYNSLFNMESDYSTQTSRTNE